MSQGLSAAVPVQDPRRRTKIYRVYFLPIAKAELAHEAESAEDAEAFADEFNRLESERQSTGRVALADVHGALQGGGT